MSNKTIIIILSVVLIASIMILLYVFDSSGRTEEDLAQDIRLNDKENREEQEQVLNDNENKSNEVIEDQAGIVKKNEDLHPMAIEALRDVSYPGGEFTIKETLSNGANYERYVASYLSEGLEIDGLLTVPLEEKPAAGYPAVIFIHGYIPPDIYSTINSYPTYQATLARAGFVTYKPDLRGHDDSEGEPVSAHYSEKYVIDSLNALAYLRDYNEVDPERIAYWGHSNGGSIGLRVVLVSDDLKAASLWAGVVGDYVDLFETLNHEMDFLSDAQESDLVLSHGLPSENQDFWSKLDPYSYMDEIEIPIQILHGTNDESVPVELSRNLRDALEENEKNYEYHEFVGDDHNIGINSSEAWQMTIDFFDENL